ncbi:hypothetical protein BDV96DRAFT_634547 [Lophiotrema nucula]|uniref:Zn(2)-C6 fungal-type domain-containing protein n=1 Tax=Lophiotrema nucula TaxID=690887 RepID=A0A6A5YXY7_9PLEO|nr:hypothetical protein BDV96DRAFT_634547 [Lophiotrema nucula]
MWSECSSFNADDTPSFWPMIRKPVSKACDACRRRKIKCNGVSPCPSCVSANLTCTFNLAQKKGGQQGARAVVLNELREHSNGSPAGAGSELRDGYSLEAYPFAQPGSENEVVNICIDAYLTRVYQVVPFLNREVLEYEAQQTSVLSRQFILAFCAYVVTFGKVIDHQSSNESQQQLGRQLLDAAMAMQVPDQLVKVSLQSVFISFFLYGALAGLGKYHQAWFHLREASTLYLMLGDEPVGWGTGELRKRLFWVIFISERAHGIRRTRPVTLQITRDTPALDDIEDVPLIYLASVFRPFDDMFFAIWNGAHECNKEWLIDLDRKVRTALPLTLELSDDQIANLRVSQLWLRIKLWELFPRFGFLSSDSVYECLTFRYPIAIARELSILAVKLPITSLQVHGIGMAEKVFDIACALADILPLIRDDTSQLELGPKDYLSQVTSLLLQLPGGASKFLPVVMSTTLLHQPHDLGSCMSSAQIPSRISTLQTTTTPLPPHAHSKFKLRELHSTTATPHLSHLQLIIMPSEGQLFPLLVASVISFTLWCEDTELKAAILFPISWATLGYGLTKLNTTEHQLLYTRLLRLYGIFVLLSGYNLSTYNDIFYENTFGRIQDLWFDRDPLDPHTPGSGYDLAYRLFWRHYGDTIYFWYNVISSAIIVLVVTTLCTLVAALCHWIHTMGRQFDEFERRLNYVPPPPPPVEMKPEREHFLPVRKYVQLVRYEGDPEPIMSWDPDWERRQRRINRKWFT